MGRGEGFDAISDEVAGVCFREHHEFCFWSAVADNVAYNGKGGLIGDHEDGGAESGQGCCNISGA